MSLRNKEDNTVVYHNVIELCFYSELYILPDYHNCERVMSEKWPIVDELNYIGRKCILSSKLTYNTKRLYLYKHIKITQGLCNLLSPL